MWKKGLMNAGDIYNIALALKYLAYAKVATREELSKAIKKESGRNFPEGLLEKMRHSGWIEEESVPTDHSLFIISGKGESLLNLFQKDEQ